MSERLYQTDSYKTEFEAVVSAIVTVGGRPGAVLAATYFYPESGGQPCDTGTLGGVPVEAVVEDGETVIHLLAREPGFGAGESVKGVIDWRRRLVNMQQHTGQHILSQAFEQVLGAQTVSSSLGTEHSTIDVSRLGLNWEDMARVEALANEMVCENRPVRVYEAPRDRAGELRTKKTREKGALKPGREAGSETGEMAGRGSGKYAGKAERDVLRIVEVADFDRSPCGGTHLRTTGETGHIKILRWEKVRETTRVEFICGLLAGADYFWKNRFVVDLAQRLTTKDVNLPALIDGVLEDYKMLRKQAAALRSELALRRFEDMRGAAEKVSGVSIITASFEDLEVSELRRIAGMAVKPGSTVALLYVRGEKVKFVFSRSDDVSVDMREAMKAACEVVGGRGGGRPEVSQGGGERPDLADEAMGKALDTVRAGLADIG